MSAAAPRLQPFELWVAPGEGPLLPQLLQALGEAAAAQLGPNAEPLRWAVTAVDPLRGLRLEGVLVGLPASEPRLSSRGLGKPVQELERSGRMPDGRDRERVGLPASEPRQSGRGLGEPVQELERIGQRPEGRDRERVGPNP